MADVSAIGEFARTLLDQARPDGADLDRRLDEALSASYWKALNPGLGVEQPRADARPLEGGSPPEIEPLVTQLRDDAYAQTPVLLSLDAIAALNEAIARVRAAGWPPVFAFVYDPFWLCARLPALDAIATGALGEGYRQIPHIWTHVVHPYEGAAGWPPHQDGSGSERLSIWVALTDATVENGCMHLVPRRAMPTGLSEAFDRVTELRIGDALRLLHASRAVPAAAGSALAWSFDVLHWGGPCTRAGHPRVSLSFEFLGGDVTPTSDERPLVDPAGELPDLAARLRAIAAGLLEYRKFEPGMDRYSQLAEIMLARLA